MPPNVTGPGADSPVVWSVGEVDWVRSRFSQGPGCRLPPSVACMRQDESAKRIIENYPGLTMRDVNVALGTKAAG